jgi:pantoate--beta-alanine ligase
MQSFTQKPALSSWLEPYRKSGRSIGFVPTMGALHDGHLSLVRRSKSENAVTVVSIFVNPTQFNNAEDLENYPRMPEADRLLLEGSGADVLFAPGEGEMYPAAEERETYDFGPLETVMEGAFRPGHFNGVAQIVRRLFEAVGPDQAYFGEKDFQQLAVIRRLVAETHAPVTVVGCPTVREPSGLAMSSRNLRLSVALRDEAAVIYWALHWLRENGRRQPLQAAVAAAVSMIEASGALKTEYLVVAAEDTLQPASSWEQPSPLRAFAAVQAGAVRLIDNLPLHG